jgi:hypothetical protein
MTSISASSSRPYGYMKGAGDIRIGRGEERPYNQYNEFWETL